MRKLPPERRRVVVVCSLVAMLAGVTPLLLRLTPGGGRYVNPAAFAMGLAVGLTFTLAVGLFVKWRRRTNA